MRGKLRTKECPVIRLIPVLEALCASKQGGKDCKRIEDNFCDDCQHGRRGHVCLLRQMVDRMVKERFNVFLDTVQSL